MTDEATQHTHQEIDSALSEFQMQRIFQLVKQPGGKHYHYNLLQSIHFPDNLRPGLYDVYQTQPGDTWTLISHKHYNRIDLWWVITGINKIDDTFSTIAPATEIKIPTAVYVREILDSITEQL